MTVPAIASSDPGNGDSDVFINKNPTIVFTDALDVTTVTEDTFQLFDRTTNTQVPITLNYQNALKKVTLVTDGALRENTSYRIIIVGDDLKVTKSVSGTDAGDDLASSLIVEFSTGDNIFQEDTTLGKEIDAKTIEGDLFLPSNVKALGTDFTVERVRPKNHTADNGINLTGDKTVKFTFTRNLNTTGDLANWVEVETYPLFRSGYMAQSGTVASTYALPTGTASVDGKALVITFDRQFPNNAGCTIKLLNNIEDTGGLDYGGGMLYTISTSLYPNVFPTRSIKRELRSIDGDALYDDYVSSLIHKNTMFLESRGAISFDSIPHAGFLHIFYSTMLDIMEDQDYEKFLIAGSRKQLGDLNVSQDNLIGRLALKIANAQKKQSNALNTLYAGWDSRSAVKADGAHGEIDWSRLWYDILVV